MLNLNSQIFWYAGELVCAGSVTLPVDEPGLLYGATVFTTLRVYSESLDAPLTNWAGHCQRLKRSLRSLGWQAPDWQQVRQGAEALVPYFPVLRITLFPNGREWITGRSLPPHLDGWQQQGIVAWLAESSRFQRSLPAHKTGNYLPTWLARQSALAKGAQEAILVSQQGEWLETSTGNLWGWLNGEWWTPPLKAGILPGLVRSQLISWLISQNRTIREDPWCLDLVMEFEAIAYCNSVVEVVPIYGILRRDSQLAYDPSHQGFQQLWGLFER